MKKLKFLIRKKKKMKASLARLSGSLIIALCVSCFTTNNLQRIDSNKVIQVYVGAIPYGVETPIDIERPEQIMGWDNYRDTIVYDSVNINRIISIVNTLMPTKECINLDIRKVVSIKTMEGKKHRLCLGYNWGTVYNDIKMEDNSELFSFIDSLLYLNRTN